jgi:uncharacterized DUF497 family protein
MDFEWDEEKRQANIEKHGVDPLLAALIFQGYTVWAQDTRQDYGELRFKSIGMVDGVCYVVVHTQRDGLTRLISAWEGGRRDRRKYQAGYAQRNSGDEE